MYIVFQFGPTAPHSFVCKKHTLVRIRGEGLYSPFITHEFLGSYGMGFPKSLLKSAPLKQSVIVNRTFTNPPFNTVSCIVYDS